MPLGVASTVMVYVESSETKTVNRDQTRLDALINNDDPGCCSNIHFHDGFMSGQKNESSILKVRQRAIASCAACYKSKVSFHAMSTDPGQMRQGVSM